MEVHRLKPMPKGYDQQLFNQLYKETEPLRKSLAHRIDHRRFGLTYEDVLSFFDDKFIFCFSKHHDEDPKKLKAFLINSLQNFKNRILRSIYTKKYSQNIISLDAMVVDQEIVEEEDNHQYYYEKLMSFMKDHLSDNALLILEIQLNPPPYILSRINVDKDKNLQKIPDELLLEYLDLGDSDNAYKYIKRLKKEIRNSINYAKTSFN